LESSYIQVNVTFVPSTTVVFPAIKTLVGTKKNYKKSLGFVEQI